MPSLREHPTPGLQLGWIPNDAGRRPRDYDEAAPADPAPDPGKEAKLRNARRHAAGWIRLLIGIGVIAVAMFGLIAYFSGQTWFWGVAAGWAVLCWLPAAGVGWHWRKAAAGLREDLAARRAKHAEELAAYEERRSVWNKSEAERAAREPRWLRVTAGEDRTRLDVFGGTADGRTNMLTGLGLSLLASHAVIVLDLSHERVCGGLAAAAADAGLSVRDYRLPRDLRSTPLLSGLAGDELASQIVEVTHADDPAATTAGRASDLLVLSKIGRVLGAGASMSRLHACLNYLLGTPSEGALTEAERTGLDTAFGEGFRREVAGALIRLAAVVEPLRDLGADAGDRPPARLTCLSLGDGPRDVTADLTAALIVQWATRSIVAGVSEGASSFRPAVILAGADAHDRRHLARLTSACDRYGIPLIRTFSRLTEEAARHLDSRNTAFMRLPTRPEALRAAEHIGLERRFVAAQFSISQRVSRSRTRTDTESSTHTTGTSEGGSHTRTVGTTQGESRTETEMPWRHQQVNVNVENHTHVGRDGRDGRDGRSGRDGRDGREASGVTGKDRAAQDKRDRERERRADAREAASARGSSSPSRPAAPQRGNSKTSASSGGRKDGKPDGIDLVKSKTEYNLRHASESRTSTWEKTESDSYTRSVAHAVTKGTSVGDEVTYELSYEHQVQPETLMDLAEDQMLAPHVAESAASGAESVNPGHGGAVGAGPGRMVALVINPGLVGAEVTAPVAPEEIPAYQAPPPQVTSDVPAALENLRRP